MNWTKTPPSKPGAYWWRAIHSQVDSDWVAVFRASDGRMSAMVAGRYGVGPVERMGGEWCGPLVPVEEVERAYREGWRDCLFTNAMLDESFATSRARKVVEGEL